MFRNLKNDVEGFINEGLETNENEVKERASGGKFGGASQTRIEISRSQYNQESLFREMLYKKSESKSCK